MADLMIRHLSQVSLLGCLESFAAPFDLVLILGLLILGIDLALTLTHSIQELRGPLWRYFGAIAGLRIPDGVGIMVFFVGLTLLLWALAMLGIVGWFPVFGTVSIEVAMAAIGALVGGRLSDTRHSHIRLRELGYIDPEDFPRNPGLASTPYYVAEAVMLTLLFLPGLWRDYTGVIAAALGFVAGWLFFWAVLRILRRLHTCRLFKSWHREPWQAGKPVPSWVKEYK